MSAIKQILLSLKAQTPYSVTGGPATTTDAGGYTVVDRSFSIANSVTITTIGAYSTVSKTVTLKILLENSSTNYDIVVSQSASHTGSGWEDFTLSSSYAIPSSGTYRLALYFTGGTINTYNVARAYKLGDSTGTGQTFTSDTNLCPVLRASGYYT